MRSGTENHLIVPFDDEFMKAYGDFLEAVQRMCYRCKVDADTERGIKGLCELSIHVEIMINEACGQMEHTEAFMDECYGQMEDDEAALFLDEVTDFHNNGVKPYGFEMLRQIEAEYENFALTSVIPMREEDTMVYTFVRLE